ncbi:MAG: tRNA (5-methylaminomethyl-2-thiouridine)(34)-methyltransferase MnmD [Gelidibacter sp.]|nr:tRNA (5-methylaminomethyl-2-thiouridine)(34)-methyltransferase MnmD [Gelidibacter sp.]
MQRKIITTADGSNTIHLEDWNEHYHSVHGAINEAYHVFINAGLHFVNLKKLSILEIGFGTGLNAFITLIEAEKQNLTVDYVGVEAFPIPSDEMTLLNYPEQLSAADKTPIFNTLHTVSWEDTHTITSNFILTKQQKLFKEIRDTNQYNLIYFDAFGARVQPELWTEAIFKIMFDALKDAGVLVTYSAKGSVRRALQAVGFSVERLPGPPGKREMLRAKKV